MSVDRCPCGALINPATAEQEYINGELAFVCAKCEAPVQAICHDCGAGDDQHAVECPEYAAGRP